VWDYEIGTKVGFLDNRLHWNTAVFDIEWSNLQVLVPTSLFSYITNAGSARSNGFETELDAQVMRHLDVIAGLTYNNARLVGSQPASSSPSAQLRAGDRLAGVPQWTGRVGLLCASPIGSRYNATARVDLSYESGRSSLVAPQNPAYFLSGGYALTNLHFNVDGKDGWGVTLDVDNLFNRFAVQSIQAEDSNLIETQTPARPRTISLGIVKRY
jgi:outer membrane receptor protein involved in Fe transport